MPYIDFDQVEDSDWTPVPEGEYLCRLIRVQQRMTRHEDEQWVLSWQIQRGTYAGKKLRDSLTFSAKGLSRVKLVYRRMGKDVAGERMLQPQDLLAGYAWVYAGMETYDGRDGKTREANKVPYAGYRVATADDIAALDTTLPPQPEPEPELPMEQQIPDDPPF